MRVRALRLAVLAGAMLALSVPAAAVAAPGNPLSPGLPPQTGTIPATPTPTVAPIPTTTTAGSSGISGSGAVIIAIAAMVILAGISFFIWRDARRRAPVRPRTAGGPSSEAGARTGSKARGKPRKLSPAERRRRKRGRAR